MLRFGDATRQSVALVTRDPAAPAGVTARATALAFEYQKSLGALALGLWRLAVPTERGSLAPGARVLCIGGGGGSLPLFLAATLPDAQARRTGIIRAASPASHDTHTYPAPRIAD